MQTLDLAVPQGAIYGFLGPNGAGKTTSIRLLLGLLRSQRGAIRLFGETLTRADRRALRHVGAMVESPSLYPHLSARENLDVGRRLLGLPRTRIDAVLDIVDLRSEAERRVSAYSMGMRQRLGIAQALLGEPRLLLLDEPTNGLDPAGIVAMRGFIQRMARELGLTVFLSSHLLGEVEQIATHVGVIDHGRLLFQGPQSALRAHYGERLEIGCTDGPRACVELQADGEAATLDANGRVLIADPRRPDHDINRLLVERGHAVHHVARSRRSLETLFLELTADREDAA
ncbi:ATP-binding cassette domain-containing protein [Oleiagrimonas soli]|uniref:ABC-2 type transport system ATP-binding protein n=1 Tax=Oleiagrimonas soli TaxID=1543381 RepID=A0A841KIW6_9GAMM|nr:ATP-binding cassette domain-containing protein [Oleiagrimonas soli]MBB6183897.1 ABC-2 type transport system ATP-binding protein [Oleiagrimonas soli]